MKYANLIIFIVIMIFCCTYSFANTFQKIEIVQIFDGDTVKAKIDNNEFKIRLIGIDCYETLMNNRAYKQAYESKISIGEVILKGKISKDYLINFYKKSDNIYFDFRGVDMYGRALGVLYFDQKNINEEMKNKAGCMAYYFKNND